MVKATKKPPAAAIDSMDAGEATILRYLLTQNRPYSAIDIFNNLHATLSKTVVTKALTALVERNEIVGKAYGKQWVYVAPQEGLPAPSPEELSAMDGDIERHKEQLTIAKEKTRAMQAELAALNNSMTDEEMRVRLERLLAENAEMHAKSASLKSGQRKVDPEEKKQVEKVHETCTKAWKQRKRMCMEAINAICEGISKHPRELTEEIGIELDPVDATAIGR